MVGLSGASAAPARQRSLDRDRGVDLVGKQHRHPVAAPNAELGEARREPAGKPIELAVGHLAIAGYHRHPVGVALGGRAQVIDDRADAHAAARFRSTNPVIASIEPKFSSVISTSSIAIQ